MKAFRVLLLIETQLDMSESDVKNRLRLIFDMLKEEITHRFAVNGENRPVRLIPYDVEGVEE